MLVELIDRLNEALGAGANVATLRNHLTPLREQAEAVEARLNQLESEAQNKDFKQERDDLQAQLEEARREIRKFREQTDELEDDAVKILDALFQNGDATIEYIAPRIGLTRGMGEYHRDILMAKGFIQQTGIGFKGFGAMGGYVDTEGTIGLTETGRKFLVRLKQK